MAKTIIKCVDCRHCRGYYSSDNASRKGFQCEHPEQAYILKYFKDYRIHKMPGFVGFGEKFADKPNIKTAPAWCPKKALGD